MQPVQIEPIKAKPNFEVTDCTFDSVVPVAYLVTKQDKRNANNILPVFVVDGLIISVTLFSNGTTVPWKYYD